MRNALKIVFLGLSVSRSLMFAQPVEVSFCRVLRSPEKYHGQELILHVGYRVGFEWQELICPSCQELRASTWMKFASEVKGDRKLSNRRGNWADALYRVHIKGVFQAGESSYGHLGGYRHQFVVTEVLSGKRVWRMTPRQDRPPAKVLQELCPQPDEMHQDPH